MSGKYWKTGAPVTRTAKVIRPSSGELLRQLGMLIVGGAILIGLVAVSIGSFGSAVAAEPIAQAPVVAASPTAPPPSPTTLPPTNTATAAATQAPTDTPVATAANTPTVQPPTAAPSPTVAATEAATTTAATAAPTAAAPPTSDAAAPTATPVTTGGAISYSRDVQPIFNQICVKCHGGEETKEGLSLKSYAEVLAGSFNGTVVTPGDAANSLLIQQILNGKMPKQGPKLLPAQVRTLSDWVAAGAPNN